MQRRAFLSKAWKAGIALMAAAAVWTTWDFLQPLVTGGFGGKVRAVPPEVVPETGVIPIPAARAYLTRLDSGIVALSQKCTHLGCRVPYCESSSQFECPCHGSVFNRAGELISGPAPRGLDRYPNEVQDDLVYIDTGKVVKGPPPGTDTLNEPPTGPPCVAEGH